MIALLGLEKIAVQMKKVLIGKRIEKLILTQKRSLNISEDAFNKRTLGATITDIYTQDKWLIIVLDNGEHILLSFNLGSDIFYFENNEIKEIKYPYNVEVHFTDQSGFTVRYWWFESFHLLYLTELDAIKTPVGETMDVLDKAFSLDYFKSLFQGKKSGVKDFLMSQKQIRGLSGMFMHDILWGAGIHPQKKVSDLSKDEMLALYESILEKIKFFRSFMDFFGNTDGFVGNDFFIAYLDGGEPCPICSDAITYIKTGRTSTYICPTCQKR